MENNSDSYEATGSVYHINETRVISEKFSVREFVVEIPGLYPQFVMFQCANKNLHLLEDLEVGTNVTVHFNLRGRESKGRDGQRRFFNSLDCWRIQRYAAVQAPSSHDDVPF